MIAFAKIQVTIACLLSVNLVKLFLTSFFSDQQTLLTLQMRASSCILMFQVPRRTALSAEGFGMTREQKLIQIIETCSDLAKLQNWINNALREGATEVADAARRRMIEVEALSNIDSSSDPLVLDFWKSITALEQALTAERGKTIRLSRTRQKIARVGVQKTLADLAIQSAPSEGFALLKDRNMLDLSAEAVVLRFADQFDEIVLQAARARLHAHDISTA